MSKVIEDKDVWVVNMLVPYTVDYTGKRNIERLKSFYDGESFGFFLSEEQANYSSLKLQIQYYKKSLRWTKRKDRPKVRKLIKEKIEERNQFELDYPEMVI